MATGLAELANALEKAVTGEKQSEPVFLGTAAKIADGLY
jgi:hypothetical protein